MANFFLLIAFWPLVCCEQCDYTAVCITVSIIIALVLYITASIVHALRTLAVHRPQRIH